MLICFFFHNRPSAPKIPDGEKVDFDVKVNVSLGAFKTYIAMYFVSKIVSCVSECRTFRRNVRTRTLLSCSASSMLISSIGRKKKRS